MIEQELRELKKSGLNLYSHTGFHWNYLAGCEISNKLINKYQKLRFKPFSSLSCDDYTMTRSTGLDTDVVLILKLLDRDRYIRQSPVLSGVSNKINSDFQFPSMTVVGDSFSDLILHHLSRLMPEDQWEYGKLDRLIAMQHRQVVNKDNSIRFVELGEDSVNFERLLEKDLLMIVIYEANVSRDNLAYQEYGLTQKFLEYLIARKGYFADGNGLLFLRAHYQKIVLGGSICEIPILNFYSKS